MYIQVDSFPRGKYLATIQATKLLKGNKIIVKELNIS